MRKRVKAIMRGMVAAVILTGCMAKAGQPTNSGSGTISASATEDLSTRAVSTPKAMATSTPLPLSTMATRPTESPPAIASLPVVGVEMNSINPKYGLELVSKPGVFWVRRNALLWSDVEPLEGRRNWGALAGLETEMKNAATHGLQLILIVRGTPTWAQKVPGVACSAVRADKIAAFAGFMHDLVARYSQPPYSVKFWEIGNEPDVDPSLVSKDSIFGCWGDAQDVYYGGGYYAEMLKVVYPQVKAASAQAQVITGSLLLDCNPANPPETSPGSGKLRDCSAARFLEGILKNGGGNFFDILGFHAYDYYANETGAYGNGGWHSAWNTTGPVSIAKARYIRSLLTAYAQPNKAMMNTESALLCISTAVKCESTEFNNTKAYYIAEVFASALAEGLQSNIWYSTTGWRYTGLLDNELKPLPAYDAFVFSASILKDAVYNGDVKQIEDVSGYEFTKDGQRVWIIWSRDGADHRIHLPASPRAIYDVFGKPLQTTQDLNLTVAPTYIEWEP
jgi:hypothetical protein